MATSLAERVLGGDLGDRGFERPQLTFELVDQALGRGAF
jgi:hypothetical protein